jgi:hypothetical protein
MNIRVERRAANSSQIDAYFSFEIFHDIPNKTTNENKMGVDSKLIIAMIRT